MHPDAAYWWPVNTLWAAPAGRGAAGVRPGLRALAAPIARQPGGQEASAPSEVLQERRVASCDELKRVMPSRDSVRPTTGPVWPCAQKVTETMSISAARELLERAEQH